MLLEIRTGVVNPAVFAHVNIRQALYRHGGLDTSGQLFLERPPRTHCNAFLDAREGLSSYRDIRNISPEPGPVRPSLAHDHPRISAAVAAFSINHVLLLPVPEQRWN